MSWGEFFTGWSITIGSVILILIFGLAAILKAFYYKVAQGTALIVNDTSSTPKVHFTGALVWPIIHKKELMNISQIGRAHV